MKPLLDKEEISRLQYDSYQAQARVAESELRGAQEQLNSAQNNANMRKAAVAAAQSRVNLAQSQVEASLANRKQVDVRRAETGTASAGVEAARANLAAAELMLSYTTIVAPYRWRCDAQERGAGADRPTRAESDDHHPVAGRVGHCELQGDATGPGPARAARGNPRGHVRQIGGGPRRFHRRARPAAA